MDLTRKSLWFLVCFRSSSVFQSLYKTLKSASILPTVLEPFSFSNINSIFSFEASFTTLLILSQFDIVLNLVKIFLWIQTSSHYVLLLDY